jgi:PTS system glucitol/sorbitol-specific IIA component
MIKFEAHVVAVGPLVSEFLDENIVVLFGQNAPVELAEFSILHDGNGKAVRKPIAPGDAVVIGDRRFTVLAVGDVANDNFKNLGHLVLKFNGEREVEMPGDVCVEREPLPAIDVGTPIRVEGEGE